MRFKDMVILNSVKHRNQSREKKEDTTMTLTIVLATISTAFIQISAILIAFGWYNIRKGRRETHKKLMISASIFALAFFIVYMSRTTFVGDVRFGGPENLKLPYTIFLVFHICLATIGGVMGIVSLTLAFLKKFSIHRVFSRYTAVTWFFTAITGIIVYVMLFILWPGTMDKSLIKAILG